MAAIVLFHPNSILAATIEVIQFIAADRGSLTIVNAPFLPRLFSALSELRDRVNDRTLHDDMSYILSTIVYMNNHTLESGSWDVFNY